MFSGGRMPTFFYKKQHHWQDLTCLFFTAFSVLCAGAQVFVMGGWRAPPWCKARAALSRILPVPMAPPQGIVGLHQNDCTSGKACLRKKKMLERVTGEKQKQNKTHVRYNPAEAKLREKWGRRSTPNIRAEIMQPMEENGEAEIALQLLKRSIVEHISTLHKTPCRWLYSEGAHEGLTFE